jgi:hypothetical protein
VHPIFGELDGDEVRVYARLDVCSPLGVADLSQKLGDDAAPHQGRAVPQVSTGLSLDFASKHRLAKTKMAASTPDLHRLAREGEPRIASD